MKIPVEPTMDDIDQVYAEYVEKYLSKPLNEMSEEDREHAREFFQKYKDVKEAHLQMRIVPMMPEETQPNIIERLNALSVKIEAYLIDINNEDFPSELLPRKTCEVGQMMHELGFDFVQAGLNLAQDIAKSQERKDHDSVH